MHVYTGVEEGERAVSFVPAVAMALLLEMIMSLLVPWDADV